MEHFEVLNPKSPRQMSSKYILLWFCMVKSFIAPLSSGEIAFVLGQWKLKLISASESSFANRVRREKKKISVYLLYLNKHFFAYRANFQFTF